MNPVKISNFTYASAGGGSCYLTGKARGRGEDYVIDTGVHIDFEGDLQICQQAVRDLARVIGWAAPEEYEARIAVAEREQALAEAVRDDAVAQFRALDGQLKSAKKLADATAKAHAAEMAVLARKVQEQEQELAALQAKLDLVEED